MMKAGVRPGMRGFTLLELMVAMAIFGMVVAAIYSSWLAIVRGSQTGQKAAAAVQRSRIAIHTLEEALTSACSFAANIQYYDFIAENGSEASLSFVARLSPSFPRSGKFGDLNVRRVTFSLEPGPDYNKQLVLRQTPLLMDMDVDEKEHPVVLAKNVKDLKLQFWDVSQGDWVDEWTQTNQIPQLVQITLQLGGNDPNSPQVQQEITRFVGLPSITVQPGWQAPAAPAADGGQRGPSITRGANGGVNIGPGQ
jgi:type II secretion system protein J